MTSDVLTQVEAGRRSEAIRDVSYEIDLELADGSAGHVATTTARFALRPGRSDDVWLDYAGQDVRSVLLDGRPVPDAWDGTRIHLPGIRPGRRSVTVRHGVVADRSGTGLVEAVDAVDGRRYLSTMFEPFGAHRVYPCFDQPDLKAGITLSVDAPSAWSVIANGPVKRRRASGDGRHRTSFRPVGPISPYVSAVMAGPFHRIRRRVGSVPIGYAVRASRAGALAGEVDAIHAVVRAGIGELERYLDRPLPVPKLDHVFVPGFRDGAMEHAGAIALEESFLFGEAASASQLAGRAEIVVHELVHMWLGNLVTMPWWDALWLKESLATYVSFVIMDRGGIAPDPWVRFEAGRKAEALEEDRRPGAHPIASPVPDTDAALVAGDDIAYGKGAAVLHQLVATIGGDAFRAGLRGFVADHAWSTGGRSDLLAALGAASGQDLLAWGEAWLDTPFADSLVTVAERGADRATLTVRRPGRPGAPGRRRIHHLDVAVATIDAEGLRTRRHRITLDDVATVPIPPTDGPVLVLPDGSGHAYARMLLDPGSDELARTVAEVAPDPLIRQLIWNARWELVHAGELRPIVFVMDALDATRREASDTITAALLVRVRAVLRGWIRHPTVDETPGAASGAARHAVDLGLAMAARPDTALGRAWLRLAVDAAVSPERLRRVGAVLWDDVTISRLATPSMGWSVATAATALAMPEAVPWAARAGEADPDGAADGAAGLAAARADGPAKARAWERIIGRRYDSQPAAEAAMAAFFRPEQVGLVAPYVGRYFETVETIAPTWPLEDALAFVTATFPMLPDVPGVLARAERSVELVRERHPVLARPLADAVADLAVAIRLRSRTDD